MCWDHIQQGVNASVSLFHLPVAQLCCLSCLQKQTGVHVAQFHWNYAEFCLDVKNHIPMVGILDLHVEARDVNALSECYVIQGVNVCGQALSDCQV